MAKELKIGMLVQYIEPDFTCGYITIERFDGDYVEGDGYRVHKDYCTPLSRNNNQSN